MRAQLPGDIQVIVRDWLSANHVLLLSDEENVLIDSGHVSRAEDTLRLVRKRLDGRRLHRLLNTHCHSDHCGGNASVKRAFGCSIAVPEGESAAVERWDTRELWLDYSGQLNEPFRFDDIIKVDALIAVGGHTWRALEAPGHDMGALMFWCEAERILISGDALWENGFGIVLAGPGFQQRLQAARETLDRIEQLDPRIVIPGHGKPFCSTDKAIAASRSRINAFAADEAKLARHVLKVMFSFSLLERQSMTEDDVRAHLQSAQLYSEYDTLYFRMGLDALGRWLIAELISSGNIRRHGDALQPAEKTA